MGKFHLEKVRLYEDLRVTCAFDTSEKKRGMPKRKGSRFMITWRSS